MGVRGRILIGIGVGVVVGVAIGLWGKTGGLLGMLAGVVSIALLPAVQQLIAKRDRSRRPPNE